MLHSSAIETLPSVSIIDFKSVSLCTDAGAHTILVGSVVGSGTQERAPLLHHNGRFHALP